MSCAPISLLQYFEDADTKIEKICSKTGDRKLLKRILKRNKDININLLIFDGWSPLHLACLNGFIDIVEFLIFHANANPISRNLTNNTTPLHMACWSGQLDVVRLLIEKAGCSISELSIDNFTPLHYACWSGNVNVCKYLILKKASLTSITKNGYSPLILAARSGRVDVVDFLANKTSSNLNCTDEHGCSSLHHACWDGQIDVVILLLQAGIDTEILDVKGRKAIELSKTREIREVLLTTSSAVISRINCSSLVPVLNRKFLNNNDVTNTNNITLNNSSLESNNIDTTMTCINKRKVIKTLRAGERRNARSSNIIPGFNLSSNSENNENEIKSPPNWKAIGSKNNQEFSPPKNILSFEYRNKSSNNNNKFDDFDTRILIQNKEEIEFKKSLASPSAYTEVDENQDIFAELDNIELQTDVIINNDIKNSIAPLIREKLWELVSNNNKNIDINTDKIDEVVDKISYKNTNKINFKITTSNTNNTNVERNDISYKDAVSNDFKSSEELKRLLNAYPTLPLNDLVDNNDWTLLMKASESGKIEVMKILIANGCDATKKSRIDGSSCLHTASLTGQIDVLKLLVSNYHLDVDEKNYERLTPLHQAAASGSLQLVHALIELHATVNCRSKSGMTPLHIACKNNHGHIVGYLVSKAFADTLVLNDQGEMPKDLTKNSAILTFLNGVLSVPLFINNSVQTVEIVNNNNLIMSNLLSQLKKNLILLKKAEKTKVATTAKSISIREVNRIEKFTLVPESSTSINTSINNSMNSFINSSTYLNNSNSLNNKIKLNTSINSVSNDPLKDMRRQLREINGNKFTSVKKVSSINTSTTTSPSNYTVNDLTTIINPLKTPLNDKFSRFISNSKNNETNENSAQNIRSELDSSSSSANNNFTRSNNNNNNNNNNGMQSFASSNWSLLKSSVSTPLATQSAYKDDRGGGQLNRDLDRNNANDGSNITSFQSLDRSLDRDNTSNDRNRTVSDHDLFLKDMEEFIIDIDPTAVSKSKQRAVSVERDRTRRSSSYKSNHRELDNELEKKTNSSKLRLHEASILALSNFSMNQDRNSGFIDRERLSKLSMSSLSPIQHINDIDSELDRDLDKDIDSSSITIDKFKKSLELVNLYSKLDSKHGDDRDGLVHHIFGTTVARIVGVYANNLYRWKHYNWNDKRH